MNDTIGLEVDSFYHRLNGPSRTFPPALLGGSPVLIESSRMLTMLSYQFDRDGRLD